MDERTRQLWSEVLRPYLAAELWSSRDAYDAGTHLPIPIRGAFLLDEPEWQADLRAVFERFAAAREGEEAEPEAPTMHYLGFLAATAQFVADAEKYGHGELVPPALVAILERDLTKIWLEVAKRNVGAKLAFAGTPRHKRAMAGTQLLPPIIAAHLLASGRAAASDLLEEVLAMANRIARSEFVFTDRGGCIFQPGVWSDHPDTAYAGHERLDPDMEPNLRAGLPLDSSHAHILPQWLDALAAGAGAGRESPAMRDHLARLRSALAVQFTRVMLEPPVPGFPAYRLNNFMDGWNGVYRWNYKTLHEGSGYGPHATSGSLGLGTWALLGGARIAQVYEDLASSFPLRGEVLELYAGPASTRARHPLVAEPECWSNGMREALVRLAAGVARHTA